MFLHGGGAKAQHWRYSHRRCKFFALASKHAIIYTFQLKMRRSSATLLPLLPLERAEPLDSALSVEGGRPSQA
jgi:hypothetical protein